ncbi:hypothetical protein PINS_up006995 [Pythium insidiosum]|nr:hypothetical protein PINS_up006995 [Pythium insidiosum]
MMAPAHDENDVPFSDETDDDDEHHIQQQQGAFGQARVPASHVPRVPVPVMPSPSPGDPNNSSNRRRASSLYNRTNGLVLSASYLTLTYGGAPTYYALWLGERCTSTVVVHLQFTSDAVRSVRLSADRVVFTPTNFNEPQIVRLDLLENTLATNMIVHRVFSLDKNYDRINTPNVVVSCESCSVSMLLSLGATTVREKKTIKRSLRQETPINKFSTTRSIDLSKAHTSSSQSVVVASAPSAKMEIADTLTTTSGQDSSESLAALPPAVATSLPLFVTHMAAGSNYSIVVSRQATESIQSWGANANGELGIGSTTPMNEPVIITSIATTLPGDPLKSVVSLSCGKHHAAIITAQGKLYTWGNNKFGQLGTGDYSSTAVPKEVQLATDSMSSSNQRVLRIKHTIHEHGTAFATMVACGAYHTLLVTNQQQLFSMGYNQAGQLGVGHRLQQCNGWRSCTPAPIEQLRDRCILDIAAGQNHSVCALSNGDVFVWGCGDDGRLGIGSGDCEVVPIQVVSLKDLGIRARAHALPAAEPHMSGASISAARLHM